MAARSGPVEGSSQASARHASPRAGAQARFGPPPSHIELVERRALLERLTGTREPLVLFCDAWAGLATAYKRMPLFDAPPEALVRLRAAVAGRDLFVTWLGVDPKWDGLRGSPAFREVLKAVPTCSKCRTATRAEYSPRR